MGSERVSIRRWAQSHLSAFRTIVLFIIAAAAFCSYYTMALFILYVVFSAIGFLVEALFGNRPWTQAELSSRFVAFARLSRWVWSGFNPERWDPGTER